MPDLVLINPRSGSEIYGSLGDLVAAEQPLWCRLIAGYVRDHGFSVEIIDADALQLVPADVVKIIDAMPQQPRLIALVVFGHQPSASTQQMVGARPIAKAISKRPTDCATIMVGGHVSALPLQTYDEEFVTYTCKGEGPATIISILQGKHQMHETPGLVWGKTVNPPAPLLDVTKLHGNAWDLLPMDLYRAHNWQCFGNLSKRQPYASIYTSLGCPYACSFCCINAPFDSNRYRMRKPEDVVAEIVMLYERYGVKTLKITDEMFVLNERHYTAICEGLIASGIADDLNIWAYARVDTVKPHTLSMLRKAGIRWLALGIESGSAHVRDGAEKHLRNSDIQGVVAAIQDAGISVIGNYIFGLPDDDLSSMRQTLDLALQLNTEFANFYSAMAYPGSRLYTDAVASGATLPLTWAGYSQHGYETHPMDTQHVSAREVLKFRDQAFITYFTNPRYLAMVEKKFGQETLGHIHSMLERPMRRRLLEHSAI